MDEKKPITIIGCGPGSAAHLTEEARQCAAGADIMIGSQRLLDLFPRHGGEKIVEGVNIEKVIREIAARRGKGNIAVLVSGDPGMCSLARPVIRHFGIASCRVVPGISSVQLAFARVGLDWYGAKIVSAHAADPSADFSPYLNEDKIAVLGGRTESAAWMRRLAASLGGGRVLYVCENLGLPEEKVAAVNPEELDGGAIGSLAVFLLVRKELLE
ncbi:MAG: precorrin-6y C5,15-methyltransferase (decarboxylating) subunit CbiE [Nitrospinae bacterium]|nr:precorrin-6y C5,15-methyltransferase (decarboxylating) subunit CbiE [Nitrospinota bacterium]